MTTILTDNRYYFAQAYGQGTYGSGTYSCTTSSTTLCTTTPAGTGGTLTNTGTMVLLVVSIACLIVFLALIVRFWRRPKRVAKSLDNAEPPVLQSEHKDKTNKEAGRP